MPSLNELSGVAHNISHHSQSSVSWLHPHLGQVCRLAGVTCAEIELLDTFPYPLLVPKHKPLELALQGLQAKFWEILELQHFARTEVHSVHLEFRFFGLPTDEHSCSVSSLITAANGKIFRGTV